MELCGIILFALHDIKIRAIYMRYLQDIDNSLKLIEFFFFFKLSNFEDEKCKILQQFRIKNMKKLWRNYSDFLYRNRKVCKMKKICDIYNWNWSRIWNFWDIDLRKVKLKFSINISDFWKK